MGAVLQGHPCRACLVNGRLLPHDGLVSAHFHHLLICQPLRLLSRQMTKLLILDGSLDVDRLLVQNVLYFLILLLYQLFVVDDITIEVINILHQNPLELSDYLHHRMLLVLDVVLDL